MRAGERVFVDTNVLLYSLDTADPAKRSASRRWMTALWESGAGRLSWQVLNEFYANAVRKFGADAFRARASVEAFATWQPVEQSLLLVQRAWHWADAAQTPYWDGLIVAAAERAECQWLLSEDFPVGQKFGTVVVINPFQVQPEDL